MLILGFDPGGADNNGVAILRPGEQPSTMTATVASVDHAIDWFAEQASAEFPVGAGIDTFLFWETGPAGWRKADRVLQDEYPQVRLSVLSSNSAHGSMAVQGMALAMRLRELYPCIALTETHPKVLHLALRKTRYDWGLDANTWLLTNIGCGPECQPANEHEWDALISAWASYQGITGRWTRNLAALSMNPLRPAGPVDYWWPDRISGP
jgi:hypothetical protein